jgi:aldose 1-epimerase
MKSPLCCALAAGLLASGSGSAAGASVTSAPYGKLADGTEITLYTLKNSQGMTATVMTYGAILVDLKVADRKGEFADVNLGFDRLVSYVKGNPLFGSVVGRYANRIANAQFTLNGKTYPLAKNNGKHHIHSGPKGFDKVVWKAAPLEEPKAAGVRFSYLSPDGENGFPGNLRVSVTYRVTENNELRIDYEAAPDQDTPVNITQHAYFNLAGQGVGDVLGHELQIFADRYTVADKDLIPTGEIAPVKGTPLDFTAPKKIGANIREVPIGGYDHNFVINRSAESPAPVARVYEPGSGRVMEAFTTMPGVMLYTANGMRNQPGKNGAVYQRYAGFCLETQYYPDAINHPDFPSPVVKAGTVFKSTTVFKFSVKLK